MCFICSVFLISTPLAYLIYCILNEFFLNKQTKNVDFGLVLLYQLVEFLDYVFISHLLCPMELRNSIRVVSN
jgi:hypothetical protein